MRLIHPAIVLCVLLSTASARAAPDASKAAPDGAAPSPAQIVANAPAADWREIAADRLLIIDLADGRRVAIELAPDYAPAHVANIKALARDSWWDRAAIVRVQDDYVVQWSGIAGARVPASVTAPPPAEYDRDAAGIAFDQIVPHDPYAPQAGFAQGWPVASDGHRAWLAHCYGMVGVGRDMPPDTGDGTELYAVIGQAPRQLDRNIALVGRVVDGMAVLASLPRGAAALGFYADPKQRIAIRQVRLATDIPPPGRPRYAVLRTNSPSFARYLAASTDRRDLFFVRPAGATDLCNVRVPSRTE